MAEPQRYRQLLAEAEAETRALIAALGADISNLTAARQGDNSDDEHDPEGATLAFERSQADSVLRESRERLSAIAEAQSRIEAGTFGICTECGSPIPEVRLEARPYAARCVPCAS
ncbi:TraR/DksA family transcriptional regulator [Brevibacterium sanguinis]|uniref:TraR/DksA family transcriptional regulator n=2 Tax=Brevibacterium TaxID=1696 RepID=A0A366IMZ5_9MICO|nr:MULTISPECIES: TraR/DksA C4-type zinc finger protein [Brevibacterium]RBP68148.1 TraR/DksA family transcriptional regulator [Brevibacterium sanguinis]RBP74435.1 TraR/DksA family transcriptional regulator [Brevibacterium celere]